MIFPESVGSRSSFSAKMPRICVGSLQVRNRRGADVFSGCRRQPIRGVRALQPRVGRTRGGFRRNARAVPTKSGPTGSPAGEVRRDAAGRSGFAVRPAGAFLCRGAMQPADPEAGANRLGDSSEEGPARDGFQARPFRTEKNVSPCRFFFLYSAGVIPTIFLK